MFYVESTTFLEGITHQCTVLPSDAARRLRWQISNTTAWMRVWSTVAPLLLDSEYDLLNDPWMTFARPLRCLNLAERVDNDSCHPHPSPLLLHLLHLSFFLLLLFLLFRLIILLVLRIHLILFFFVFFIPIFIPFVPSFVQGVNMVWKLGVVGPGLKTGSRGPSFENWGS